MYIARNQYLERLKAARENGLIKIVTGLRRCGKSYLLFKIFRKFLIEDGVKEDHIIGIALDDLDNATLRDGKVLLSNIRNLLKDSDTYYVLLDEVQLVEGFTDVLNSLLHNENVDVYVTGSNSRFLSSDIATNFRGRGYVINLHPLSFAEYVTAFDGSIDEAWEEYYTYGGLPLILSLEGDTAKSEYLSELYRTVYLSDIKERHDIRHSSDFSDLVSVLASSIGSPANPLKLANTFKSTKKSTISSATVSRYIDYLCDAFITEKSVRFDLKGKRYIGSLSKYYFTDIGIRNAILGFRQQEESHIMENIIFNELRIRGFRVDVGNLVQRTTDKQGKTVRKSLEVDFVADSGNNRYYIQSALDMPTKEKVEQETRSLREIGDSFKKIVVVKGRIKPRRDDSGILTIGLFDFLLHPESLDL